MSSHGSEQQDGDRSHTFRKRRLSLPLHHLSKGSDSPSSQEDPLADSNHNNNSDEACATKAHTFRKRRLSLTAHRGDNEDHETVTRQRRASVDTVGSVGSNGGPLASRTMHSAELLSSLTPPSPALNSLNVLYHQQPVPLPESLTAPTILVLPKWKKRRTVKEDHKMPFPKEIVGTYSCHGVEPIYDSDYEHDEHGEEESGWDAEGGNSNDDEDQQQKALDCNRTKKGQFMKPIESKPTTAAKINQDRGGIVFPYGNSPTSALFAVYDGHGQGGELVSQFTLYEVQRRLEKHPLFHSDIESAFKETFLEVDDALRNEPLIDPLFAGTTACVALVRNQTIAVSNVGDSRAVLARRLPSGVLEAMNLTEDQNPDLPEELKRILSAGGYVSPSPGPGLSARVWLDPNFTQIGLAMARSIGDHAVSTVGVIAEPVVTFHEIDSEDEFMILASDGVWEFITSQEAVDIIGQNLYRGATKACQALIEAAAAKWHDEEGEYRDDITAIVVKLPDLWGQDTRSNKKQKTS